MKVDKEKKVFNIQSKFLKKSIDLDEITRVKLNIPHELRSKFKSAPLQDLDRTIREYHNNIFGGDRGATLYLYNNNKLLLKLKHIDIKSISLVQKIVKQIDESVGIL